MGKTITKQDCCCGPGCECGFCAEGEDGPCCFLVRFEGIEPLDPEECHECECMELTHYVENKNPLTNSCIWGSSDQMCDGGGWILLQAHYNAEVGHWIEINWFNHVWKKIYGEQAPNCSDLDEEEIPFFSTDDDECDVTASTAYVTARHVLAGCARTSCLHCRCDKAPRRFQVVFSGVANDDCDECTSINGVPFILELDACGEADYCVSSQCCNWFYHLDDTICSGEILEINWIELNIRYDSLSGLGWMVVKVEETSVDAFPNMYFRLTDIPYPVDCCEGPWVLPGVGAYTICDESGATATVTPLDDCEWYLDEEFVDCP